MTFLLPASNATPILWVSLLQLPYWSRLCSERDEALSFVPSMTSIATSYFTSPSPIHSCPSASPSSIFRRLILLWNVEKDGVSNWPPASSLAFPAICLYLILVNMRNIADSTKYASLYLKGRPLLPLLISAALETMIDSAALVT